MIALRTAPPLFSGCMHASHTHTSHAHTHDSSRSLAHTPRTGRHSTQRARPTRPSSSAASERSSAACFGFSPTSTTCTLIGSLSLELSRSSRRASSGTSTLRMSSVRAQLPPILMNDTHRQLTVSSTHASSSLSTYSPTPHDPTHVPATQTHAVFWTSVLPLHDFGSASATA